MAFFICNSYLFFADQFQFWETEILEISNIIEFYPGHESLWNYRRFLFYSEFLLRCEHPEVFGTKLERRGAYLTDARVTQDLEEISKIISNPVIEKSFDQKLGAFNYLVWISRLLKKSKFQEVTRFDEIISQGEKILNLPKQPKLQFLR